MSFTRRFTSMPSAATLLAVSGVVLVDAPPARPANAAAFGKIAVVGEFEDGPFDTATDLLSSTDQATIFGLFGYRYGSEKYQYACAVSSGGSEEWNGNGWVQTSKLLFNALCFVRVDTSVGSIGLTPRAFIESTLQAPFALDNGLTLIFNPNGTGNVTVTFSAAAASVTASSGTYNSFTGGEQLQFAIDGGSTVTVTFSSGDTTLTAIISRINTTYGQTIASNASSQLKISSLKKGTGSSVAITASSVATTLGLSSTPATGTGDAADISQTTQAELKAKVEAASALVAVTTSSDGYWRLVSKLGGSGTLAIGAGTANSALGLTTSDSATAALAAAVSVPAGTRLSDGGDDDTRVVTMQTTAVAAGTTTTTLLKVRPAVDDGTYAGLSSGSVDTLEDIPGDAEWSISQPSALGDALSASELDSLYLTAIDATVGVGNDTTKEISGIVSARQSSAIRSAIKANAINTSASGHNGRRGFICLANGSTSAQIISGVASYRAEEASLCCPGIPCILQEMIDGGYSTDGEITRHADVMLASRWSVLNPGYNPGQLPEEPKFRWDSAVFTGLESVAAGWDVDTYAAFKEAGVCAAVFNKNGGITFEQGITTVDPSSDPSRVDISRKTLADYIGDTFADLANPQAKRQGTQKRRENLKDSFDGFLDTLVPDTVDSYDSSFTTDGQPTHVVLYQLAADPTQSDDVIVLGLSVGPNAVKLARG